MTDQGQVLPQRRRQGIAERLSNDLGYAQPRHISIRGGRFSLVDDTGTIIPCHLIDQQVGYYIDIVVADANEHKSKIYYGEQPYTEGDNTPPLCFSDNGVAPSINAIEPQSVTCQTCPLNEIGSKISQFSGASIKACADRKKIAAFIWNGPPGDLLYQFVVPPASLSNMRGYLAHLVGHGLDPSDVVTRVYFEPQKTGVLNFYNVSEIDARMDQLLEHAFVNNMGASICGRDDQPRQGALPAPRQAQQLPPPQQQQIPPQQPGYAAHAQPPQQPQYLPPQQPQAPAPGVGFQPIPQHGVNVMQPQQGFQQLAGVQHPQPATGSAPPPPRKRGPQAGTKRGPRTPPGQPPQQPPAPQGQPQGFPQQQPQPAAQQTFQQPAGQPGAPDPGIPPFLQRTQQPPAQQDGFGAPQQGGFGGPPQPPQNGTPQPQPPAGVPGGMVASAGAPDPATLAALQAAFSVSTNR